MADLPSDGPPAEQGVEQGAAPQAAEQASSAQQTTPVSVTFQVPPGTRLKITIETSPPEEGGGPGEARLAIEGVQRVEAGLVPTTLAPPVTASPEKRSWTQAMTQSTARATAWTAAWLHRWPHPLETTLFGLGLVVYLATRLIGLTSFPIYFFSDEAIQTVLAADLVHEGLHNYDGEFLPTYFYNIDRHKFNLSTSVYLQVVPYLIFGKHIWVTRTVSVLMTLLAAVCAAWILRDGLNLPYWWSGTLLLSIAPAWFLHSRTAFETMVMASFYAAGLYLYILYRLRSPRYLYACLVMLALAFYSYSPGQFIIGVTAILLLLSDLPYHWRNRRTGLRGLGLVVLLALPYLRFRLQHPTSLDDQLMMLNSYWIQSMPLADKLRKFVQEYFNGLSPIYWFTPNDADLFRHLMKGYGHMHLWLLPFTVLGLILAIINFRSPTYRVILIALVAGPVGAALVQAAITRLMPMILPLTLLAAAGIITILTLIEQRWLSRTVLSLLLFGGLCLVNGTMLFDALNHGPTWYQDYSLGGMQYGAQQLFGTLDEMVAQDPQANLIVSPNWTNGTGVVARFFLPDPTPIQLDSIYTYLARHEEIKPHTIFVLTPEEYQNAIDSGKFTDIQTIKILPYPNSQPGFIFVTLRYVDNVDEIFKAEDAARRVLQEARVLIDGQPATVHYSLLDMGQIQDLWDHNLNTLTRTYEANPYVIDMDFDNPRSLQGLDLVIGDTEAHLKVDVFAPGSSQPQTFEFDLKGSPNNQVVSVDFGQTVLAHSVRLEYNDQRQVEPAHIHIWEISFR
jgi:4-amino-4-deoxy-L-arabinose transferase-like glycosyltransferase